MANHNRQIETLLNKYWNCETSVQEEKELREYFSQPGLPEELEQYASLFTYIEKEQSVTLSAGFDQRLETLLKEADRKKYVTIRIFAPVLRIAASVLLIGGLGISLFFISRQHNKPWFVETYDDPNAALQQATYALEKLSDALRVSEEASIQTIQTIDNLDIDWTTLDSLGLDEVTADSITSVATDDDTPKGGTILSIGKREGSI